MTKDNTCFYCQKDTRLDALMVPLCERPYANVYLLRDQKHPGRCVVATKAHVSEIYQLGDAERDGFFADVAAVAKALHNALAPDKLNYAVYGDLVPHFHLHLVPKTKEGLRWGEPFSDQDPKQPASEDQLEAIKQQILSCMR